MKKKKIISIIFFEAPDLVEELLEVVVDLFALQRLDLHRVAELAPAVRQPQPLDRGEVRLGQVWHLCKVDVPARDGGLAREFDKRVAGDLVRLRRRGRREQAEGGAGRG